MIGIETESQNVWSAFCCVKTFAWTCSIAGFTVFESMRSVIRAGSKFESPIARTFPAVKAVSIARHVP